MYCRLIACALFAAPLAAQGTAHYITTEDGTRLAADVHLPSGRAANAKVPALLELTRYWRASERPSDGVANPGLRAVERRFLEEGYALVKVDVRGSGASFGTRDAEYGPQEVRDGRDVIAWVARQDWCDGNVGAYGTSYTGTTAELLTTTGHPALKAVIPGWSDFDLYESPARPYGLFCAGLIEEWSRMVAAMDRCDASVMGANVRRVDGDDDGELREAAVAEHAGNLDVGPSVRAAAFRDSPVGGGPSMAECSARHWSKEIQASGVPMLVLASWLDAGTAGGALERLRTFSNPQHVVILASSHGGGNHASPFVVGKRRVPPVPSFAEQIDLRIAFFDHHLKGDENEVPAWPRVRYHNLGEEALRETDVWPPAGTGMQRMYLGPRNVLGADAPPTDGGSTAYEVDFGVGTGSGNRWMTQMGRPVLRLDDRGAMDARMAVWDTVPLESALQVTGTPVVTLAVSSTHADGALLVYLEDVDAEGRSRYVTEGGVRLLHRKSRDDPEGGPPRRSYAKDDAEPLEPGAETEVRIALWPTSVRLAAGHRLRLAIAGADGGTFARVPAEGTPVLEIHHRRGAASFLELPVVRER